MERDFKLEPAQRQEAIWFIRQYYFYKQQYNDCLTVKGGMMTIHKSGSIGDPVFATVNRMQRVRKKIDIIEKGLSRIPEEYRSGILEHITKKKPYPYFADPSTWKRWQRRFVWYVYWEREFADY